MDVLSDLKIIKNSIKVKESNVRPYIYKDSKNVFLKYNPISLSFGGLLFVYQNSISYQFSADCLYNPSCSEFSKNALREYGFFKGCFLTADRLTRCNRISATGIHYLKIDDHTHKVHDEVCNYSINRK
jgi:putative membrane protein insertion efficiency factor